MKTRIRIIDPIVKKNDAIQIVGGKEADLARFFSVSRTTVGKWGDNLPPLYAYRILEVYPQLEQGVAA